MLSELERTLQAVESFGGAWASTQAIKEEAGIDVRTALTVLVHSGQVEAKGGPARIYWRPKPNHNHDAVGLYADCPACGTLWPKNP